MRRRHDESSLQQRCVKWFRYQHQHLALNLIAIPNGGARNIIEAAIMKGEGVTAGASDLFLFVANSQYHGLAIEMKIKDGVWRDTQKTWAAAVEAQGYKYIVIRSFDQFTQEVEDYLNS